MCVCAQDLSEVLHWLSNQAVVHWLAPRPRIYYQNAAAAKIIQVWAASCCASAKGSCQPPSGQVWLSTPPPPRWMPNSSCHHACDTSAAHS